MKFLEETIIEYFEDKLPVLKGKYKCEIDGTICKFSKKVKEVK